MNGPGRMKREEEEQKYQNNRTFVVAVTSPDRSRSSVGSGGTVGPGFYMSSAVMHKCIIMGIKWVELRSIHYQYILNIY